MGPPLYDAAIPENHRDSRDSHDFRKHEGTFYRLCAEVHKKGYHLGGQLSTSFCRVLNPRRDGFRQWRRLKKSGQDQDPPGLAALEGYQATAFGG